MSEPVPLTTAPDRGSKPDQETTACPTCDTAGRCTYACQQTTAMRWVEAGAGYIASCGEHQQGEVMIRDAHSGGYLWQVDMLPYDMEPAIYGLAGTLDAAKAAA